MHKKNFFKFKKENTKAVIFDLWGTLVKDESIDESRKFLNKLNKTYLSIKSINSVYNYLYRLSKKPSTKLNIELPAKINFISKFFKIIKIEYQESLKRQEQIELDKVFNRIFNSFNIKLNNSQLTEVLGEYYKSWSNMTKLYDDVLPTLVYIHNKGIKLAVISNTIFEGKLHDSDLKRLGIFKYFDFTIYSSDVGVRKPDSKIFKVVLEKLKVSPDEAIFVGDRLYDDIKGAKSVGMTAVLKEKRPYTGEEEIVPDLVIKNISDLKLYI
ncbi:MAG: HAD family hydrolase [Actinomycetota bacterium]